MISSKAKSRFDLSGFFFITVTALSGKAQLRLYAQMKRLVNHKTLHA
jgi:hypothetical protein